MPNYRKLGLPKLTGNPGEDIQNLRNVFYQQDEQLRYLFEHLDGGNFTDEFFTSINDGISRWITENRVELDTAGLVSEVLSAADDAFTRFEQTVEGITLTVVDSEGNETSINLSSGKLDLTGLVTFQDLSTKGKTTINGGNITTGTINADLITAGTIRGISYYSQSTENINDYLTIGGGNFESRRYVRTVNGYDKYAFVTVKPGELRCSYGDLNQENNNAYYSYDGLWLYAGDDASDPESLVSCFALESDKSLLIYGKNGIGFEGTATFTNRLNANGGIYYSNTSIMQMINSNADLAIGWGSLNASAGSTYVAAGKNVYLRSGTDAIYMFPCYKNSPAPCAVVVGDSGGGDPNVHPSATGGRGYLGTINYKWKSVYATTGTIQTSDRRLKRNITDDYSKYEKMILGLRPITFDYIDLNDGIERTGFIAQEVLAVMEQCGIDAKKTLFVIDDKIDPESALGKMVGDDHVLGMNYEQFIVPIISVVQKLEQRITELEQRTA